MDCTNCKNELAPWAQFCLECGNKMENVGKICTNNSCKRTGLPEDALFCPDCGTKLTSGFSCTTETVNGISFQMVRINGGTYAMGSNNGYPNEKPVHKVTISDFAMSQTEVTQALWLAVMGSNPSCFKGDSLPVESVSWDDCNSFIVKLNRLSGKYYRLPTEAEWEYAARGGNKSQGFTYSGANTIDDVAEYRGNNSKNTKAVGSKQPNELGLYDMSGNVWEWCSDWYGPYKSTHQTNPIGPTDGSCRVYRGGSWCGNASCCQLASRGNSIPDVRDNSIGFRLVLVSSGS